MTPLKAWPILVFLLTVCPLRASGWIPFTQTSRIDAAADDQWQPTVASNGFDYLVGWETSPPSGSTSSVYVTRVNSDGTLATDVALPLDPTARDAHSLTVVPGRDGYFATWISDKGLNVAIMDSYGRIERRATVPQDDPNRSNQTLAAWNGAVSLVVSGAVGPFVGTLVDNNGEVLGSNIPIGDTHGESRIFKALTADSAGFLILSTKPTMTGDAIYGRRINSSGVAGDWFLVRSVASSVWGLSVASDGFRDVIVWSDEFGLWTLELDAQSNITSPSRQLGPDRASIGQVIIANGRTWITYETFRPDTPDFAITIESNGMVNAPVLIGLGQVGHAASNGSTVLSVQSVPEAAPVVDHDIVGRLLSLAAATAPFLVSKSKTEQRNGDLVTDREGNVIAVWDEKVGTEHRIFAARFDTNRTALDPSGVQVSATGENTNPSAAFNGTNYLVVWTQLIDGKRQTVARRFSPDGRVLDSDDAILGDASYDSAPRVAWDGSNWLVVWVRSMPATSNCGNSGPRTLIYAARVSASGVVLDPEGIPIAPTGALDQIDVDLGWAGSRYVVAWTNVCSGYHQPTQTSIGAAVIAADLSRAEVSSLSLVGSSRDSVSYGKPRVVPGPDRSLIAWQRTANGAAVTEFRIIDNGLPTLRKRAVGPRPVAFGTVSGPLIAAGRDVNGHFIVLTEMTIPTASPYQGLFMTTVASEGIPQTTTFLSVLDNDEIFLGDLIPHDGALWIAESLLNPAFDPVAGARRLWIREY